MLVVGAFILLRSKLNGLPQLMRKILLTGIVGF